MTDPPFIGAAAELVARRFGAPLVVISQDVFPEIAVELRRLGNPLLIGLLSQLVRFYLTRADRVVAIGETMRRRLEAKGAPPERLSVIPNWVDTTRLVPKPRDNEWARENGLVDQFVVMHSGNVGHAQNLEALVRATTFLRDLDDFEIVIVGYGAMLASLVEPRARFSRCRSASCRTSRARSSRTRSRRPTSTSSGSRRGSPATSFRAGSTGSSRSGGR